MERNNGIKITKILNAKDLQDHKALVDEFFELYINEANFPDETEREDPAKILLRIGNMPKDPTIDDIIINKPDPFTHLLCLEITDSENKRELAAGCIVEYYPISMCALITYIFVDPKWRRKVLTYNNEKKGLGQILLTDSLEGLPHIIDYFNRVYASKSEENGVVKAVFFESNNPLATDEDSMPPYKRLKFFKDLGAKQIDFEYIQPPIGTDQPPVTNLFLLTFPKYSATGSMFMPILTIITFVLELAKSLDKNQETEDEQYGNNFERDLTTLVKVSGIIEKLKKNDDAIDLLQFLNCKEYELIGYSSLKDNKNILQSMFAELLKKAYIGTDLIYLSEIPRTEEPNFSFKRASLTMHVLVDEDYFTVKSKALTEENGHFVSKYNIKDSNNEEFDASFSKTPIIKSELMNCPVCHSYETDLFAYHNQFNAPYYTKSFRFGDYVVIKFPSSMLFTSEGRKESMYIQQPYKQLSSYKYLREKAVYFQYLPLRLSISYTYFLRSNIRVWNLSFTSSETFPINEFAIIKLAKFFTGSQENKSLIDKQEALLDKVGFFICNEKQAMELANSQDASDLPSKEFKSLPEAFFGEASFIDVNYSISTHGKKRHSAIQSQPDFFGHKISYKNIKTGTIQVDMSDGFIDILSSDSQYPPDWKEHLSKLFNDLYISIKPNIDIKIDVTQGHEEQTATDFREDTAKMLCGTTLGIFDFDRMGFEEIDDTLTPRPISAKKYSFLTINRGALTSYHVQMDSVLDSAWYTLGASPYLIIPNTVLTHNEYVLLDADELLGTLRQDLQDSKIAFKTKIGKFIKRRNYINDLLNDDYLNNVFHYKTERDLYEYGSLHRGITDGINNAKGSLHQIDILIDQLKSKRDSKYQKIVETIGFVIGSTTIFAFSKDAAQLYITDIAPGKADSYSLFHTTILFAFPLFLLAFGFFFWYRSRNTLDEDKS